MFLLKHSDRTERVQEDRRALVRSLSDEVENWSKIERLFEYQFAISKNTKLCGNRPIDVSNLVKYAVVHRAIVLL